MSRSPRGKLGIVGLGDSTTAGTPGFLSPLEAPPNGAGYERSQYAYWLAREHADWDILNSGINGERSDQILARFDRDVVGEQPKIVVILAGVNDIFQGFPAAFAIKNLSRMYSKAVEAGIAPVSCTVLPYNFMGKDEARTRRDLNTWIQAEARKLGIGFCDTAATVSARGDPDRLVGTPDGLHPDVDGYRSMAAAIGKSIEGCLSSHST